MTEYNRIRISVGIIGETYASSKQKNLTALHEAMKDREAASLPALKCSGVAKIRHLQTKTLFVSVVTLKRGTVFFEYRFFYLKIKLSESTDIKKIIKKQHWKTAKSVGF